MDYPMSSSQKCSESSRMEILELRNKACMSKPLNKNYYEKPTLPHYLTIALTIYKAGNEKMRAYSIASCVRETFPFYASYDKQQLNRFSRNISSVANYKIVGKSLRIFNKTVITNHEVYLQVNNNLATDLRIWLKTKAKRDTSKWMKKPDGFIELIKDILSNAHLLPPPFQEPPVEENETCQEFNDSFNEFLRRDDSTEILIKQEEASSEAWENITITKPVAVNSSKQTRKSMEEVISPPIINNQPEKSRTLEFGLSFEWREINPNFSKFFLELLDGDTRVVATSTREYKILAPHYKRHAALFNGNYPDWEQGYGPKVDLSKFCSLQEGENVEEISRKRNFDQERIEELERKIQILEGQLRARRSAALAFQDQIVPSPKISHNFLDSLETKELPIRKEDESSEPPTKRTKDTVEAREKNPFYSIL